MRGVRGGPVEAGPGSGRIGGGAEGQDRGLFRDVVGFERGVQYLQQEGAECFPLPLVDLHALACMRVSHDVGLLGHEDRRDSED